MEHAVRVDERVADPRLGEVLVDPLEVSALGEPDPLGIAAERDPMVIARDANLGAHGRGKLRHEWEEAVRRAAGRDVELPGVPERAKRLHEVEPVLLRERAAAVGEVRVVHLGERAEPGLPAAPIDLLLGEFDEPGDVLEVALLEERVLKHRDQGRAQGDGQTEVDTVVGQALEGANQRDVRLGDRLEQPVLFEEALVLRVSHVRKVRVKDQAQVAFCHAAPRSCLGGFSDHRLDGGGGARRYAHQPPDPHPPEPHPPEPEVGPRSTRR
jgi:hypothetical protein